MKTSRGKGYGRWTLTLISAGILLQTTEEGCRQQVEATLFGGMESFATTLVSSMFTASATLITTVIQAFFLGLANRGTSGSTPTVQVIIEHAQQWLC